MKYLMALVATGLMLATPASAASFFGAKGKGSFFPGNSNPAPHPKGPGSFFPGRTVTAPSAKPAAPNVGTTNKAGGGWRNYHGPATQGGGWRNYHGNAGNGSSGKLGGGLR